MASSRAVATYNLSELFEQVVDVAPDRMAVVTPARRLTYRELDERANRLAHHLAAQGLGRGQHVALHLTNGTGSGSMPTPGGMMTFIHP